MVDAGAFVTDSSNDPIEESVIEARNVAVEETLNENAVRKWIWARKDIVDEMTSSASFQELPAEADKRVEYVLRQGGNVKNPFLKCS